MICTECAADMGESALDVVAETVGLTSLAVRVLSDLNDHGFQLFHQGPVDPQTCYGCGRHVHVTDGEQQGRAGWVHYACNLDLPLEMYAPTE